jgi:hypothetical protein
MEYERKLNLLNVKELKAFIKGYNLQMKIVMTKKKKEDLIMEILKHTDYQNGKVIIKSHPIEGNVEAKPKVVKAKKEVKPKEVNMREQKIIEDLSNIRKEGLKTITAKLKGYDKDWNKLSYLEKNRLMTLSSNDYFPSFINAGLTIPSKIIKWILQNEPPKNYIKILTDMLDKQEPMKEVIKSSDLTDSEYRMLSPLLNSSGFYSEASPNSKYNYLEKVLNKKNYINVINRDDKNIIIEKLKDNSIKVSISYRNETPQTYILKEPKKNEAMK